MMIAGGVVLLSLALGGVVDGEAPAAPAPLPPGPARPYVEAHAAHLDSAEPAPAREWYGWQLVAADAACIAIGHEWQNRPAAVSATAGMVMAAPLLHLANGDWKLAIGSAAVRGALMAAAIHLGGNWSWSFSTVKDPCGSEVCEDAFHAQETERQLTLLAVTLAGAAAIVVDDAVLSERARPTSKSGRAFAPTIAPTTGGLSMGLVGIF